MRKLIVAVALVWAGCGAPSSFDLCHDTCEALRRCGINTDAQAQNCHTDCNNRRGSLADQDAQCERDCTNCGQRHASASACLGMECNKIVSCGQAVDNTCVKRN